MFKRFSIVVMASVLGFLQMALADTTNVQLAPKGEIKGKILTAYTLFFLRLFNALQQPQKPRHIRHI